MYLELSMETGSPISFWEDMQLSRFREWVSTWYRYIQEKNEQAKRAAEAARIRAQTTPGPTVRRIPRRR